MELTAPASPMLHFHTLDGRIRVDKDTLKASMTDVAKVVTGCDCNEARWCVDMIVDDSPAIRDRCTLLRIDGRWSRFADWPTCIKLVVLIAQRLKMSTSQHIDALNRVEMATTLVPEPTVQNLEEYTLDVISTAFAKLGVERNFPVGSHRLDIFLKKPRIAIESKINQDVIASVAKKLRCRWVCYNARDVNLCMGAVIQAVHKLATKIIVARKKAAKTRVSRARLTRGNAVPMNVQNNTISDIKQSE